jgi:hypothetical protein
VSATTDGRAQWLCTAGIIALTALGCAKKPKGTNSLTADERQQLQKKADDALVFADARASERLAVLKAATSGRLVFAGPCPVKVPMPPPTRDASQPINDVHDEGRVAEIQRMTIMHIDALEHERPTPGNEFPAGLGGTGWRIGRMGLPRLMFERGFSSLEEAATGGDTFGRDKAELFASAADLVDPKRWTWELVIVADLLKHGQHNAKEETFETGVLAGTALLYDFASKRIVCGASVRVTNRDNITLRVDPTDTSKRGHQMLSDDLHNAARRAAVKDLRAYQPRVDAAPGSSAAANASAATNSSAMPATSAGPR